MLNFKTPITISGNLQKNKISTDSKRASKTNLNWFELQFKNKIFGYKESSSDIHLKKKIPFNEILNCNLNLSPEEKKLSSWEYGFKVYTTNRIFILFAIDQDDMDKWLLPLHIILIQNFNIPPPISIAISQSPDVKYKQETNYYNRQTLNSDFVKNEKRKKGKNEVYDIYDNIDEQQLKNCEKKIDNVDDSYLEHKYDAIKKKDYIINEDMTDFNYYDKNAPVKFKNQNKEIAYIKNDNYTRNKFQDHYFERLKKKGGGEEKIENLLNDYYIPSKNKEVNLDDPEYMTKANKNKENHIYGQLSPDKNIKNTNKYVMRDQNFNNSIDSIEADVEAISLDPKNDNKNKNTTDKLFKDDVLRHFRNEEPEKDLRTSSPSKGDIKKLVLGSDSVYDNHKVLLNNFDRKQYSESKLVKTTTTNSVNEQVKKGKFVIEGLKVENDFEYTKDEKFIGNNQSPSKGNNAKSYNNLINNNNILEDISKNLSDVTAKKIPFEAKTKKNVNIFGNKLNNPNDEFEHISKKQVVDNKANAIELNTRFSPQKAIKKEEKQNIQVEVKTKGKEAFKNQDIEDDW